MTVTEAQAALETAARKYQTAWETLERMSDKYGRDGDQRAVWPHLEKAILAERATKLNLFGALAALDAARKAEAEMCLEAGTCPECHGAGKIEVGSLSTSSWEWFECRFCHGTGRKETP